MSLVMVGELNYVFVFCPSRGMKRHSQSHWNMVLSCAYQSTCFRLFFFSFKRLIEVQARVNFVAFVSVLSSCGLFARTTCMSPGGKSNSICMWLQ